MNINDFAAVKQFKFMNLHLPSVINDFLYFSRKLMVHSWFIHSSIDTQLVGFVDDMQESG